MCGRFTLRNPAAIRWADFGLRGPSRPMTPRYNIAPTQEVDVIRIAPGSVSVREQVRLRWGLVPSWSNDQRIGSRMINARSETAAEKPAFRDALRHRRCLILADGFYEWEQHTAGTGRHRPPYFFLRPGNAAFAYAGLWEAWERNGEVLETCTILNTAANAFMRRIHERVPVVIERSDYDLWLDQTVTDPRAIRHLLRPPPDDLFVTYQVSARVNSVRNDDEECVSEAVADGGSARHEQPSLFE